MPQGDQFSSGECSYMTASVASLRSFDACFEVEISTPGAQFYHRKDYLEHAEVPKNTLKQGQINSEGNQILPTDIHQSNETLLHIGIPSELVVGRQSNASQKNSFTYAEATRKTQGKNKTISSELASQAPTVSEITLSDVQTNYTQDELVKTVSKQSQQISELMASLQDMSHKYQELQLQNQQDIRSLMRMFEIKMAVAARNELQTQQAQMTPDNYEAAERKRMSTVLAPPEDGELHCVKRTDIKQSPMKSLRPHAGMRPILLDQIMNKIDGHESSEEGRSHDHNGMPEQARNDFNPQSFEENGLQEMNHD
jgi:hypothetical protein